MFRTLFLAGNGSPIIAGSSTVYGRNTVAAVPLQYVQGIDPWWGAATFMYGIAAVDIPAFAVCVHRGSSFSTNSDSVLQVQMALMDITTTNTGRPVVISMQSLAAGTGGWFMVQGITPIRASVAIGGGNVLGVSTSTAGNSAANSAGRQIIGARTVLGASSVSRTYKCNGVAGSDKITVPNAAKWFCGIIVSHAAIPANTTIKDISPDDSSIYLSNPLVGDIINDVVTARYQSPTEYFNICYIDHPHMQGAIT